MARSRRSRLGPRFEPHPIRQRAMLSLPRAALWASASPPVQEPCRAAPLMRQLDSIGHRIAATTARRRHASAMPFATRDIFAQPPPARSGGTSRPRPQVVDYRSLSRRPPNIFACCDCVRSLPSQEHPCSLNRHSFQPCQEIAKRSGDEVDLRCRYFLSMGVILLRLLTMSSNMPSPRS